MALTRLGTDAIGTTLPVSKGGTGVTTSADLANTGNMVLLSSQTASDDASISFTSGIDSTYEHYVFRFKNIHPATDSVDFRIFFTTDGTNFNENVTGTGSLTYRNDAGDNAGSIYDAQYQTSASATGQVICLDTGNENDESINGELEFYSPSNSTFKKHYHGQLINSNYTDHAMQNDVHGYVRTTSAVTGVKFDFSSGNIQSGSITLFGVKT